jgi:ubiquinone/menaquinone biosynthesis C-methylase UbiE
MPQNVTEPSMTDSEKTVGLFQDQSEAFGLYRPEYPKALYDWIASFLPDDQRGVVIDIACGTGKSTVGLTRIFLKVCGLDLELNQIRKAKELYADIQFLVSKAERSPFRDRTMDCVTVATAFYWFNMPRALEEFRRLLRPKGHLFIYRYDYPVPKNKKVLEIQRREYDTHWRYHKDPRLTLEDDSGEILKRSSLCQQISHANFPNIVKMNAAQMAGFWSSTSYGAAFARNTRDAEGYWKSLTQEFDSVLKGKSVAMDFTVRAWHGQLIA